MACNQAIEKSFMMDTNKIAAKGISKIRIIHRKIVLEFFIKRPEYLVDFFSYMLVLCHPKYF